jgi:plastocyanin
MFRRSVAASLIALFVMLIGGDVIRPAMVKAGGGCHMPDGSVYTEGPATVIRMDVCSFGPTIARVPVGTTVQFLNTAPNQHQVIGRAMTWGSDVLEPGASYSNRFVEAGIYAFSCPLHPGMVGAVVVGDAGGIAAAAAATVDQPPASETVTAQPGSNGVAVLAGAGGGLIGLLVGAILRRRRPASTAPETLRTTSAPDR